MKRRDLLLGLSAAAFSNHLSAASFSLEDITGGQQALKTDVSRQVAFWANCRWAIYKAKGLLAREDRSPTGYTIARRVTDPAIDNILNLMFQPLARTSSRTDLDWRIGLVNNNNINACTVGAGVVFINSGLILACQSEEELAGVIAHEIGHVDYAHGEEGLAARQLLGSFSLSELYKDQRANRELTGFLSQLNGLAYKGYDRLQEHEADGYAVKAFFETDYDVHQSSSMIAMMIRHFGGKKVDELTCLYRSHPDSLERLERLRLMEATFDNRRPPRTSGKFAELQQRLSEYVNQAGHHLQTFPEEDFIKISHLASQLVLQDKGF